MRRERCPTIASGSRARDRPARDHAARPSSTACPFSTGSSSARGRVCSSPKRRRPRAALSLLHQRDDRNPRRDPPRPALAARQHRVRRTRARPGDSTVRRRRSARRSSTSATRRRRSRRCRRSTRRTRCCRFARGASSCRCWSPIEKIAAIANAERPDVLVGYGGWIDLFFKTIAARGIDLHLPKMVMYMGEALPHGARELHRRAFRHSGAVALQRRRSVQDRVLLRAPHGIPSSTRIFATSASSDRTAAPRRPACRARS